MVTRPFWDEMVTRPFWDEMVTPPFWDEMVTRPFAERKFCIERVGCHGSSKNGSDFQHITGILYLIMKKLQQIFIAKLAALYSHLSVIFSMMIIY